LPGIGLERLRLHLEPRLPAPAFAAALQSLARLREVALDGAWARLPSHHVRLTPAEEKLWRSIQPLIDGKERFRPPRVRDVGAIVGVPEAEVRRVFKLLGRLGKVDEVAHDHFFLRATVADMVEIGSALAAKAPNGQFTAADFRDQLDNGRKVAIQILEFFDRHGVTIRRGDLRRMNKHRLDLFRRPADEPASAASSGREASPVGRPDFKSGGGREPVFGGFDSHSLPPRSRSAG
jgi:selenocysteine-specific elongation factor